MEIANALRDEFRFAVVRSKELTESKHGGKEGVIAARPFDGEPKAVEFDGKVDGLKDWMISSSIPLAGVFTPAVGKRYDMAGLPKLALFAKVSEHDPAGTRYILNRLRRAAVEFKGKLAFVAMDKSSHEFSEFGFADDAKVAVGVLGQKKFKSEITELNVEAIKAFASDYIAGKLEPYFKSEPIPEKNDEDVRVIVGKTFDQEVLNSDADVFIVAYAPWCGHCKALHPKWEELAKKLKPYSKQITIAKIDATANDLPSAYGVRGFPTIFWVPRGKGMAPEVYNGGREVKDLEEYVRSHVSSPLKDEL